jgi:hypothetical protein
MKHDAIVDQGIPIHERVPIPEDMIPADSRVEIDAKIQAGYCKSYALADGIISMTLGIKAIVRSCNESVPGYPWNER